MSASKEKNEKDKNVIKEQMEYYLGDENLKKDNYFHQKISEDANGYLELDYLLNCNKCKKAGWTIDDLKEGIKLSDKLELDKTEKKVRRKDNKALPELVLLSKKRKKEDEEVEEEHREPVILMFTCKESNDSNWKDVCQVFKDENPELNIIYSRFKDNLGHFSVIPKSDEELKFKDKFSFNDVEYTVKKCEGEDLINFYKEHEKHYKMCVEMHKRKNKKNQKNKSKGKNKNKKEKKENNINLSQNIPLKEEVTLGEKKFKDAALIKAETRRIINDTKDDEKLKENDHKFILDLLKYHHNYDNKSKDLDHITVGKPKNYDSSRCFIIVNKKNEKDDFSVYKCIENLVKKINGE
jgi:hypothetical protein